MKAPAFQFYAQDFLTGCAYLTNDEIGMYVKMICKQWTDGKIPVKRLEFLIGTKWENLSDELKEKFVFDGEFLHNKRLEIEREKQKEKSETAKKNADKRWKKTSAKPVIKEKKQSMQTHKNSICKNDAFLEDRSMNNEDETEEEKEIEVKKSAISENLILPFNSENFKTEYENWKDYKLKEFRFKYKSIKSEQVFLNQLFEISNKEETTAISILKQSISNGWKGVFKLKNNHQNAAPKPTNRNR